MKRYLFSILFILLVIVLSGSFFFRAYWEHRFDTMITQQSRIYRIDEKLIWSLIYEESYFFSASRGEAGEVGLMQVTPLVARDWAQETGLSEFERQSNENVVNLLGDPQRNLQIGCWYYEKLREKYRGRPAETAMTLAAYNAGPSRVEEWLRDVNPETISEPEFVERIGIPSTKYYVVSILERYRSNLTISSQ